MNLEFTCFEHFDAAILSRVSSWRRRISMNFFGSQTKIHSIVHTETEILFIFILIFVLEIQNNVDVDHFFTGHSVPVE